jgi:Uma2 family endonuclease
MSAGSPPIQELLDNHAQLVPLTSEQYHRMIQTGILPEGAPIELIDGFLVRKDRSAAGESVMSIGHEHMWVVKKLARLDGRVSQQGCHVQTQGPVILGEGQQPEPDGAILRGQPDDYRRRLASAADVSCVVEVADSSLTYDRTTKQRIYADAGIAQYIIVNLADGIVEVFERPLAGQGRYSEQQTFARSATFPMSLPEGRTIQVEAQSLLP